MVDIDPLTDLTIKLSRHLVSRESKFKEICVCVSRVIRSANRISLWQFNESRNAITCLCLLEDDTFSLDVDQNLSSTSCQDYFSALFQKDVVIAPIAQEHPDTSCLSDSYLQPNNIYSLLDYIFHQDFVPIGIICCEATDAPVAWTEHDVAMLRRIANITSMFY
ncbi:hypothetical protein OPS25_01745 [Alteromonas ponticola]|uniref:GAF domain-containing protein n=1 Tax=Alteromonas aquimaris TaxID=2998417 RepID=A0ABT3P376_9ALTE|nr:hypothetical protein [Alteromonas aquimaris]MCW8107226.1 hypothetical protein [Alteromonas aquimaris]